MRASDLTDGERLGLQGMLDDVHGDQPSVGAIHYYAAGDDG